MTMRVDTVDGGFAAPPADDDRAGVLRDLVAQRRSCRAFLPEAVPNQRIERILITAQQAASWCNSQPWETIVTVGGATDRFREALYAYAAEHPGATSDLPFPERYVGIYKERQRECGWQLYAALGIQFGDRAASARQAMENFRLFDAPHVALITTERELGVYGVLDCGGYVANLLLAATAEGVGTIAQAALAMHGEFIRDYFRIPDNRQVVCGISFGYADPDHPANAFRTSRADISDSVTWVTD